jgi:hypothetical protein
MVKKTGKIRKTRVKPSRKRSECRNTRDMKAKDILRECCG